MKLESVCLKFFLHLQHTYFPTEYRTFFLGSLLPVFLLTKAPWYNMNISGSWFLELHSTYLTCFLPPTLSPANSIGLERNFSLPNAFWATQLFLI